MIDIKKITAQIQHNCMISDSRYAGMYSICGLALRLRDLYKWEKGLKPWIEKEPADILDWIGRREEAWDALGEQSFKDLNLSGNPYDPFDIKGINMLLQPQGFYYGAGYGGRLKPTFFLAAIDNSTRINGYQVLTLGKEFARDLFAAPALTQDNDIIIRKMTAETFLWDQMIYVNKSGRVALQYALKQYDLDDRNRSAMQSSLGQLTEDMLNIYLHHELGELSDNVFQKEDWQEIIAAYPQTPVELFARAVKDVLADTCELGTLKYILSGKRAAALGFYVAFMQGVHKIIFPEIVSALNTFIDKPEWIVIERAIQEGHEKASNLAKEITGIHHKGKQSKDIAWAEKQIICELMKPLNLAT